MINQRPLQCSLFCNSLFVVKPVIWHLHTEAGSLCVPLLSQSEPHRKSDSSLQRETKTPSFIFHNLEPFKSLCFLFLFVPIMPSKMSPPYSVLWSGAFHKDKLDRPLDESFALKQIWIRHMYENKHWLMLNVVHHESCFQCHSQRYSLLFTTVTQRGKRGLFCGLLIILLIEQWEGKWFLELV